MDFYSLIIAVILGLLSGLLSGLLPSINPSLAFILFLPFIPNDPFFLICYAIISCIGAQFFGSQAVFYYKLPGESSSVPLLMEMHNLNDPYKIRKAIEITTIGSLVASVIGILVLYSTLSWGLFSGMRVPLEARALVFLVLVLIVILSPPKRWLINLFGLAALFFFANYDHISLNVIPLLPTYFFNNFLSVLIILSMQMLWAAISNTYSMQTADKTKTNKKTFLYILNKYKVLYAKYGLLGCVIGIIPGAGATLSSYVSYSIEKNLQQPVESRIAASETANNSAIITGWMPLLILGVPITSIEILLADHFAYHDFVLTDLQYHFEQIFILGIVLVVSTLVYTLLALFTNEIFYKILSKIIFKWYFAFIMITICILSYVWLERISIESLIMHLFIFVPLSFILYRLQISLFAVVLGFILSSEIIYSWTQVWQIYS